MATNYNPRIVTDGLVLCLDATNIKSTPKTNILGTWTDYGGNQANYEILGTYSVKLKNTTTAWVGRFPATISSTGKYVITFTYYSDSNGSTLVLDNDGIMDNTYNTTLTANIAPQTYTGSVDVTTTGDILHYFRRNGGGNIFVTDVSYFKLETTLTDLSGNGNNGSLVNGVGYDGSNGGSLTFDGVNDYGTIPHSSSLNFPTALTISVWYYSGNVAHYLYLKGRTDGDTYNPLIYTSGGYSWTGPNGRSTYSPPSGFIQANTWYNLTVSHISGSNPIIYRNAVPSTSHVYTEGSGARALGTNSWPVGINADVPRGVIGTFNGKITSIQAYNRALTASEIQQNFNATRGRYGV